MAYFKRAEFWHRTGFRLPNDQLEKELKRMEQLWAGCQSCPPDADLDGFRLKENPFFLKLCPRIVFDPDDAGLIFDDSFLRGYSHLIIDRDSKYTTEFREVLKENDVDVVPIPTKSPNCNPHAERFVRSIK